MSEARTDEKVVARVRFTTTAVYDRNIEMTRAQWEQWNQRLDKAEENGGSSRRRFHEIMFDELGFQIGEPEEYDDPELDVLEEVTPPDDEPEEPAAYGLTR